MRLTQLDQYVLRQLLIALAAVTAALVALIWLTQSLRFVELVVNRGLSLRVFIQLTSLLIPGFCAVVLPITSFAVVLGTYQRLLGDRELTVMRAAGLSPFALARPAIMMAAIAAVISYALTLYVVPVSNQAFRQFQFEIRNKVAAFLLEDGVFSPMSDQLTVYVRKRDPDGTLHGIIVQDERDKATRATILAQTGHMVPKSETPRVALYNGTRQEIDTNSGRLSLLTFAADTVDLETNNKSEESRLRDVGEMGMDELLSPDPHARDSGKFMVEAHRRLTQPLTCIGFSFLALVTVLTGAFSRAGSVVRPLVASIGLVGLLALGLAASSAATSHPGLVALIWVVSLGPSLAAALVLFRPPPRIEQTGTVHRQHA